MTWPRDVTTWIPGSLPLWMLCWVLIVLIVCQHMRPRPARYAPPTRYQLELVARMRSLR